MESKLLTFLRVLQSVTPLARPPLCGPLSPHDASYLALKATGQESLETALYTVSGFPKERKKRDLDTEFSLLYKVCMVRQHEERMNRQPEVQGLNRYCDILPYEDTRVKLDVRDGRNAKVDHFVNANFIHSSLAENDRKIIAA